MSKNFERLTRVGIEMELFQPVGTTRPTPIAGRRPIHIVMRLRGGLVAFVASTMIPGRARPLPEVPRRIVIHIHLKSGLVASWLWGKRKGGGR